MIQIIVVVAEIEEIVKKNKWEITKFPICFFFTIWTKYDIT